MDRSIEILEILWHYFKAAETTFRIWEEEKIKE